MASDLTIYHNPRYSKSRATLQILLDRGLSPRVVEYLTMPPQAEQLQGLLEALGMTAAQLVRRGEPAHRDAGLDADAMSPEALIQAIIRQPELMQRPIVSNGGRAIIGRPPENVLDLL